MKLTYSEMVKRTDFLARFRYLKLDGQVGVSTFGFDRHLNQRFYQSAEWKRVRDMVLLRDDGCDLGIPGREILDRVLVHHMNPLEPKHLIHGDVERMFDMDQLICVSARTHNAIHFADESQLESPVIERRPGDTTLW